MKITVVIPVSRPGSYQGIASLQTDERELEFPDATGHQVTEEGVLEIYGSLEDIPGSVSQRATKLASFGPGRWYYVKQAEK